MALIAIACLLCVIKSNKSCSFKSQVLHHPHFPLSHRSPSSIFASVLTLASLPSYLAATKGAKKSYGLITFSDGIKMLPDTN